MTGLEAGKGWGVRRDSKGKKVQGNAKGLKKKNRALAGRVTKRQQFTPQPVGSAQGQGGTAH